MHSPIKTNKGYLVRWSGPEQIFGMLVRIDRSTDLLISIPILSKATPETNIDLVEIDGNTAEIKKDARRISFILPKRTKNSLGDITNLSFKCSPLASTGEVSVGVCVEIHRNRRSLTMDVLVFSHVPTFPLDQETDKEYLKYALM